MISKQTAVYYRQPGYVDDNVATVFNHDDPDLPDRYRSIFMPVEAFEQLGRPETITVTIEPGDRLNS